MVGQPKRESLTVLEIRSLILEILENPRAGGLRSPRGLRDDIRATAQKKVTQANFDKALDQEVEAGNVRRGDDRVWLPKMEKRRRQ